MGEQVKHSSVICRDMYKDFQGITYMDRMSLFKYINEYREDGMLYFNFWDHCGDLDFLNQFNPKGAS